MGDQTFTLDVHDVESSSCALEDPEESRSQLPSPSAPSAPPGWKVQAMTTPMVDPSRLYTTQAFIAEAKPKSRDKGKRNDEDTESVEVVSVSISEQEQAITKELLYVLNGVGTNLISVHKISEKDVGFTLDEGIDDSLRGLTLLIARVGACYHRVQMFVEEACNLGYGSMNQALSAAMRDLLRDYHIRICQLETMHCKGELTLKIFWSHFQQTSDQMDAMAAIAASIEKEGARGGRVLSVVHQAASKMLGNPVGVHTCCVLAEHASRPYFRMVQNWMYKGGIDDPFNEFFIAEGESAGSKVQGFIPTDHYWKKRYKYDMAKCPNFLRKRAREILRAGKYLNVLLQCEPKMTLLKESEIHYSREENDYVEPIGIPYNFASSGLMNLMLAKYDLMGRLISFKSCLLLEQGDFVADLLDLTRNELCKPVGELSVNRLHTLVDVVLHTCRSTSEDPYKDNIKVELFPNGIHDMLAKVIGDEDLLDRDTPEAHLSTIPGIEAFSLKCEVTLWPVSLVFSQGVVAKYQLIFRHLFFCKYVERRLCDLWYHWKDQKKIDLKVHQDKASAFALRQKMYVFVQNLLYYATSEVIEPAWETLLEEINKAKNLDRVIRVHSDFLGSILSDCMLTNRESVDKMTGLLSSCLQFCDNQSPARINPPNKGTTDFDKEFTDGLCEFLREILCSLAGPHVSNNIINIVYRMNVNDYYSTSRPT